MGSLVSGEDGNAQEPTNPHVYAPFCDVAVCWAITPGVSLLRDGQLPQHHGSCGVPWQHPAQPAAAITRRQDQDFSRRKGKGGRRGKKKEKGGENREEGKKRIVKKRRRERRGKGRQERGEGKKGKKGKKEKAGEKGEGNKKDKGEVKGEHTTHIVSVLSLAQSLPAGILLEESYIRNKSILDVAWQVDLING